MRCVATRLLHCVAFCKRGSSSSSSSSYGSHWCIEHRAMLWLHTLQQRTTHNYNTGTATLHLAPQCCIVRFPAHPAPVLDDMLHSWCMLCED
jgi:hypothetical protein